MPRAHVDAIGAGHRYLPRAHVDATGAASRTYSTHVDATGAHVDAVGAWTPTWTRSPFALGSAYTGPLASMRVSSLRKIENLR